MARLDGELALITGAACGTGAETARRFVERGARVLLTDVLDERGAKLAAGLGECAAHRRLDVRDPAKLVEEIESGKRREALSGQPRQPLGRGLTLREIALAIAWLASDESSNAMDLAVNGGFTAGHIFPGAPWPE